MYFVAMHRKRGMTALEAVLLIAVILLMIGAIIAATRYVYRGQRFAFDQADAIRNARTGIERIVQDMREAAYADDGAYPVAAMSTSTVTFYSDIDRDESIEKVRYYLENEELRKGVTEAVGTPPVYSGTEEITTITQFVRNEFVSVPLFTYYDSVGSTITNYNNIADAAYVSMRLVVNLLPERAPEDYELRGSASLRNIRE